MNLRLPPGEEKRFLAQLSTEAQDSSTLFFLEGHLNEESATSGTEFMRRWLQLQSALISDARRTKTSWIYKTWICRKGFFNTVNLWKFFRASPLKSRFPSPLLGHMDFLDELQAPQNISDVVQPPHFGCKHRTNENKSTITRWKQDTLHLKLFDDINWTNLRLEILNSSSNYCTCLTFTERSLTKMSPELHCLDQLV